jgi:hypothetical protein
VDVIWSPARGATAAGNTASTAALAGVATRATSSGTRVTITCGAEASGAAHPIDSDITQPSNTISLNLPISRRGIPVLFM